jgi:hypothetical protein
MFAFVMPVSIFSALPNNWGQSVAQLVAALRYKPEGRGFDWTGIDFFHGLNPSGCTMALEST